METQETILKSPEIGLPLILVVGIGLGSPILAPCGVFAGTTGKIAGRIVDSSNKPVAWAEVRIVGSKFGATTTEAGDYTILNVPPGTVDVTIRHLSFRVVTVQGVLVSADQTARVDATLEEIAVELEEVVVTAKRPPVDLDLTSSQATITREEIDELPVQELDDVVNLQAGVVEGHFRGGRLGEVQYQVDGVSVNNAYDNMSTLNVDRSLIQEVQVISGTFDAEYGQAMSGVVNAVLREGTETFQWSAEAYVGGYAFSSEERLTEDVFDPAAIQSYQGAISGPIPSPIPDTSYLLSTRYFHFDDYVAAENRFVPTDESDFQNNVFAGTGDGSEEPLGYNREWSGAAKITNTSIPGSKISYQVLFNASEGRRNNYAFRLNPDGASIQDYEAICHGFDWTKTFTGTSYMELNLRQIYSEYEDMVYADFFDPRYEAAGPPDGDDEYENGAYVQGVEFTRFMQTTNAFLMKGAYVNQLNHQHLIKTGGEMSLPVVQFGTPGFLVYTSEGGVNTLNHYYNQPPDYPAIQDDYPILGAAYVQDQMEWPDLTLRAGMRFDYFDARSTVPSDLSNPANAIDGAPMSVPVETTAKFSLSPRLGVSYPIEDWAALHFAYGHFQQFPPIGQIFANSDYAVLANLQSGGVDYGVLGNPDVEPERTVQYEFGYKHVLNPDLGLDVTTFYKDIRDLLGVEFISTYNGAEYARLTNVDFGDILGVTVALDHRSLGPLSVGMDYTWQQALGNASDPRETATRASAGEDPRPRIIPFNWDQRHTFNMTATLGRLSDFNASAILRVASGQPYTPLLESGFGAGLESNSGRKPAGVVLDIRGEKFLGRRWGADMGLFMRAFNVFDQRSFNGPVFASTGSPYYSRFPEADEVALADPTRFSAPRRIELGLRLGSWD